MVGESVLRVHYIIMRSQQSKMDQKRAIILFSIPPLLQIWMPILNSDDMGAFSSLLLVVL